MTELLGITSAILLTGLLFTTGTADPEDHLCRPLVVGLHQVGLHQVGLLTRGVRTPRIPRPLVAAEESTLLSKFRQILDVFAVFTCWCVPASLTAQII